VAAPQSQLELPRDFQPHTLLRRAIPVVAFLAIVGLVVLLAPGLGEIRDRLRGADPGWLVLGVVFEFLSCVSYVLMFRPIFCAHMPWRASWEISWSELAVGSLLPASGAGGLALGAWILRQGGMPVAQIARRSVAFFLIKSSVNFVAVALIGTLMAVGLVGPDKSLLLTALPAGLAILSIVGVLWLRRLTPPDPAKERAGRIRRGSVAAWRGLLGGIDEAVVIARSADVLVLAGSVGYWLWDNAVLWAAFHAFGSSPPVSVILMGYLVGQLGGALPLPGGLVGIDLGLFGMLVAFGAPVTTTAAAVLVYRVILFWLPLMVGAPAFVSLRRGLNRQDRPELCFVPPVEPVVVQRG
jgi:uncharacterized membrane protein YbhN (UPF0104 family)